MELGVDVIKAMSLVDKPESGLFYPDQKIVKQAELDMSDFDFDLENLDFVEIVQSLVDANGLDIKVDEELIEAIMTDKETKDLVDSVMNQTVDYMAGKTDKIDLNPEKIEKVVVKSINTIEEKTGTKIDYDPQELKSEIALGVQEAAPILSEALDEVKKEYGSDMQTALDILALFTIQKLMILIGILVVLVVLIFVLNMNLFAMLRFISIPAIIVGILYVAAALSGNFVTAIVVEELKNDFEALIQPVTIFISLIFRQLLVYGIATLIPGVVLCVTGYIGKAKSKTE